MRDCQFHYRLFKRNSRAACARARVFAEISQLVTHDAPIKLSVISIYLYLSLISKIRDAQRELRFTAVTSPSAKRGIFLRAPISYRKHCKPGLRSVFFLYLHRDLRRECLLEMARPVVHKKLMKLPSIFRCSYIYVYRSFPKLEPRELRTLRSIRPPRNEVFRLQLPLE